MPTPTTSTTRWTAVSPEGGRRDDFKRFAGAVDARGMKLVLDGVFNPMGRNSPKFLAALAAYRDELGELGELGELAGPTEPGTPARSLAAASGPSYRDWFAFGPEFEKGARSWWRSENLPELNLENPAVRDHLYNAPDTAVRQWLRDGADGWRLDVAVDIGYRYLAEHTAAAHDEKPGPLVVGEIACYPQEWVPSVDAVMHFTLHCGSELGRAGGDDPEMRAPMRWDWAREDNPELAWTRQPIALHQDQRALRVGNLRPITTHQLLAFERHTDRVEDTVLVITNPGKFEVTETVMTGNSRLMSTFGLIELMTGASAQVRLCCGLLTVTVPAGGFWVQQPETRPAGGYSSYQRVP